MEASAPSPAPDVIIAEAVSEKDKIYQLEEKITELIRNNEILKEDNERIINGIKGFAPFLGNDYHWLKIDKVCLTGGNPHMDDNPFSGEIFDLNDMKKRMITQNYWGCNVSEDGKCYYTPAKYKYILASLIPVPLDKDEKSVFYIRIPKIDMKINKDGFGELKRPYDTITDKDPTKEYHGGTYRKNPPVNAPLVNSHKFVVRNGRLRNLGLDDMGSWDGATVGKYIPFKGECDNIHIPSELYCTNCKCIKEGVDWKMYECFGH